MSRKKNKYKVAIVDDHELFASSLRTLIDSFSDFETIFHLKNGRELQKKLKISKKIPDVLLLDVNMPVMNGFETAEWLSHFYPDIRFLALTMDDDEFTVLKMLRLGAKGYLLKEMQPEDLYTALKEVIDYGYYHTARVSNILVRSLNSDYHQSLDLKENELTFIKFACTEMTYREIAEKMFLSPKTIDGYRQELFNRFDIKNRVGLVIFALKNNIVKI